MTRFKHTSSDASLRPLELPPLPPRPLVSIIITNYNYAAYVGQAIQSCLDQTYRRLEVIVIDDGSTDDSCAVIERYVRTDRRVRLIRKGNGGMASCWNAGYAQCRGDLLCPLDADDSFCLHKLDALVEKFHDNPRAGLAVHAMTVRDERGRFVQQSPFLTRFEEGWLAEHVLRRGGRWRYMPTSALCLRRELGPYVFPIPEQLFPRHADAMLVSLAPLLTEVVAIEEPLSLYRFHGRNNLGGAMHDAAGARKVIEFVRSTTQGVNERLEAIGLPQRVREDWNLEFIQATFIVALEEHVPMPELLRRYRGLASALRQDDLYSEAQKLLGLFVYGLAIALPRRLRPWWLGQSLGYSRMRRGVQKLIGLRGTSASPARPPAVAMPQEEAAVASAGATA